MRVTFFPLSAIGYIDYPEALLTRGLAAGLAARGHDIRIVEQRRNPAVTRTLSAAGSGASRHAFDRFPNLLMHSYQPRSGAALMEWLSRELSLVDVAVAVHGVQEEVGRWIANLTHPRLVRFYLAFETAAVDESLSRQLELDRYDGLLTPEQPAISIADWSPVPPALHDVDMEAGLDRELPEHVRKVLVSPDEAALALERAAARTIARRQPPGGTSASHSSNSS